MTWLRIFTKCVLVIALAGLILLGFFFAAILLSDLLPLRPDVICGLMVVGCLVIATVRVLIEAARDDGR